MKKLFSNRYYAACIALFCSILWGSSFPVLKISYTEMEIAPNDLYAKIVLAGIRFFIASMLLFIFIKIFMPFSIKVENALLKKLLFLGILQTTLQYFFFYIGIANTSGMKGSILSSTETFFVVLLAHFFYDDDKINSKKVLGLIAGLIGIIIVNMNKGMLDWSFTFGGEGFLIIFGLISALGTLFAKNLSKSSHPFLVTCWQMLLGSILLILIGLSGFKIDAIRFTTKAWILLIYSAFLSATAYSLWYSLLKYNKAGEITLYRFMIPISGAILSAVFIPAEKVTYNIFVGLMLVALGIIIVNYQQR